MGKHKMVPAAITETRLRELERLKGWRFGTAEKRELLAEIYRLRHEAKAAPQPDNELARLKDLLQIARCPDPNCDGKGTVVLGEYQHNSGEVEPHLEQCQWCAERDSALRV